MFNSSGSKTVLETVSARQLLQRDLRKEKEVSSSSSVGAHQLKELKRLREEETEGRQEEKKEEGEPESSPSSTQLKESRDSEEEVDRISSSTGSGSLKRMGEVSYHVRLVILGGGGVGKTAIVKRFLFNTYCEKYRPTVEDLFFKEFNLGTLLLKVDFLDTAGDLQFPAMRRLSITNGQAFILVYAINDPNSFSIVKNCLEEIREVRSDYQEIPIIFVGNKSDVGLEERLVLKEDVAEWVFCDMPKMRAKVMECSAKTNANVREIFKAFLGLAKIPLPTDDCGLRRRSSAHASVPKNRTPTMANTLSPHRTTPALLEVEPSSSKLKPRSRSLIRRTSKKVNKVKDPNSDPEDCAVS